VLVQFLSASKSIQREKTFGRYVGYYLHVTSSSGSGTHIEVERSDIYPEFLCETCKLNKRFSGCIPGCIEFVMERQSIEYRKPSDI